MINFFKKNFIYKNIKKQYLYVLFILNYINFNKLSSKKRFNNNWKDCLPCLNDKSNTTPIDRHYVIHTAWAARKLKEISPTEHTDISSYIYFSTIASAFVPIKFYDYRPAPIILSNFSSEQADLTHLQFADNSIESLSCLHTIEHVGLGRYGDTLDPEGDIKAIEELKRVIKSKGNLILVVPIGRPKIVFNAHRIYSYHQILEMLSNFELKEFSLVPDDKNSPLIINATRQQADQQNYGCGCFWFIKK